MSLAFVRGIRLAKGNDAENVSTWWRLHVYQRLNSITQWKVLNQKRFVPRVRCFQHLNASKLNWSISRVTHNQDVGLYIYTHKYIHTYMNELIGSIIYILIIMKWLFIYIQASDCSDNPAVCAPVSPEVYHCVQKAEMATTGKYPVLLSAKVVAVVVVVVVVVVVMVVVVVVVCTQCTWSQVSAYSDWHNLPLTSPRCR